MREEKTKKEKGGKESASALNHNPKFRVTLTLSEEIRLIQIHQVSHTLLLLRPKWSEVCWQQSGSLHRWSYLSCRRCFSPSSCIISWMLVFDCQRKLFLFRRATVTWGRSPLLKEWDMCWRQGWCARKGVSIIFFHFNWHTISARCEEIKMINVESTVHGDHARLRCILFNLKSQFGRFTVFLETVMQWRLHHWSLFLSDLS